mmetsp:Transcript_66938/g.131936  ORF Transcript_66938/g.131936 Transcript_66938/m.131936 type:complete len:240 (+) Transcript_66938:68-787(+)
MSYDSAPYQPHQGASSSNKGVEQLFARLTQEIEEHKPKNCIHFVVDFLCKHYPEHLHGFASIWQMDPDLEGERHEVVNFFKAHKISTAVAAHFANAGYDTLDTLTTLSPEGLVDIEAFNNVKWLPGHKVRLQQIFQEISARVRAFREQQQLHRPTGAAAAAAAAQRSALATARPYSAVSNPMPATQYYSSALPSAGMPQMPPQLALPSAQGYGGYRAPASSFPALPGSSATPGNMFLTA